MTTPIPTFAAVALILTVGARCAAAQTPDAPKTSDSPPASAETSAKAGSATQKSDTEADGVTAELVSVARTDGDSITIKFKYSNAGEKDVELAQALTNYSPNNLATMVYYVDGKNKKKYSVIKDSSGEFLASGMKNVKLEPGESKPGWAKLPAPAAGVETITVYLPGTPPFEGVKIES